jgi:outer membrane protein OmpA-like peptidoglycan-associated protein
MRQALAPSFAAILLLSTCVARAQDARGRTFNLQLFRPAIDSKGYFTVDASQVLGHLDFSVGLIGTYARDVLELHGQDGSSFRVSDFVTAQVQAALGLFKRAELGVSLPVHILFGSRGPTYVSPDDRNANNDLTFGGQMIGDLGLHAKVRLLHASTHPLGLALIASYYAPTGDSSRFFGEGGGGSLRPQLVIDRELGPARRVRVALETGALVRFGGGTFTDHGTTLTDPGVNGGAPFCFPAPSLTMAPGTCGTGQSRSLGTQLTYGLGLSGAVVPEKLDLVAELTGYADVTGNDHGHPMEWLAGAKVYLASKSYFELGVGTGILPDQTGSPRVRAFVGFSFEPSIGDRDHDGIPDDIDRCPDEPETRNGFEDEDGCPDELPPAPVVARPPEPDKSRVRLRRGAIEILDQIHFETAKATIRPISFPVLEQVTATLKDNPQIKLVEIQGHADERGDDDYNLRLTEDRAQAVKQFLIEHGIDPVRLTSHGYGETRPLCHEHDDECWSKNRRVEFIIVRQEGAIPGVQ